MATTSATGSTAINPISPGIGAPYQDTIWSPFAPYSNVMNFIEITQGAIERRLQWALTSLCSGVMVVFWRGQSA